MSTDKKRILIVDDEPAIRELCQRVLTEEGFEVDTAADGRIAQSMISKWKYSLYLVDIKMPLMDGKELYESLQETDPSITSRVVFTTGSAIGQETERFIQSSGRPVLLKPFTTEELKAIVTQNLKGSQQVSEDKSTILVVDDEEHVRKLLQRILEEAGYNVLMAGSGQEALDKLAQPETQEPLLILLDIMMPELNGFQTLERIRERYDTPVIMLTAVREVTSLRDALDNGADGYVTKPFHTPELLAHIKAKLRRSKR